MIGLSVAAAPGLLIRLADAGDIARISELAKAGGLAVDAATELGRPQALLLVVVDLEQVAGFMCCWLSPGEAEVIDIAVDPALRRRGLGTALLRAGLAELGRRGAERVVLEVRTGNVAAVALYQRLGFEAVGERLRYYGDGEDARLMACCVSASG